MTMVVECKHDSCSEICFGYANWKSPDCPTNQHMASTNFRNFQEMHYEIEGHKPIIFLIQTALGYFA